MQLSPGVGLAERINAIMNDPGYCQRWPKGYPDICDEEGEMGESSLHTHTCDILIFGLEAHFAGRTGYRVFRNLNFFYSWEDPNKFVAPDAMVVETSPPLPVRLSSYRLGQDGPVPRLMAEVLSPRNYQEVDLQKKPELYRTIGAPEYILIDVSGALMPRRLLMMRRQADGNWREEQDAGGGVTSQLGFRLIIEADGELRVLDVQTDKPYLRPDEARSAADQLPAEVEARRQAEQRLAAEAAARRQAEERQVAEAEARRQAEERIQALEEELARLRGHGPRPNGSSPQA